MCVVEFQLFTTIHPFIVGSDIVVSIFAHVFIILQTEAATTEELCANIIFPPFFIVFFIECHYRCRCHCRVRLIRCRLHLRIIFWISDFKLCLEFQLSFLFIFLLSQHLFSKALLQAKGNDAEYNWNQTQKGCHHEHEFVHMVKLLGLRQDCNIDSCGWANLDSLDSSHAPDHTVRIFVLFEHLCCVYTTGSFVTGFAPNC